MEFLIALIMIALGSASLTMARNWLLRSDGEVMEGDD